MKTKIICTIGPSSLDFKTMKKMKSAGMDIVRINTKYGDFSQWEGILENAKKLKLKILIDIKGDSHLAWVKKQDFDYLAVSFTESSKMIQNIKKRFNSKITIISKIETRKGFKKIDEILEESFGIMVARGDLSKNVHYEKVPALQREILKKCYITNKFGITATEMLLSMTNSKTPTNAEVNDVATAIFLGSKGIMLSEETSIGKYPVLSVKTMRKISKESEKSLLKI